MSDVSSTPMQMSLSQAEQAVASMPMSDQRRAEAERQINEVKQQVGKMAKATVDEIVTEWQEDFTPLSAALCKVGDDYARLVKAAELGQLTADEFTRRLNTVRKNHRGYA